MSPDSLDQRRFVDQAFIGEVEIEAEYCLAAASSVDRGLKSGDVAETFRSLHSLLSHAAMISKLLWPVVSEPKAKAARMRQRAQRLLEALSLPPDVIATLESRELRNALEHSDERLDDWGTASPRNLIDRNIGPPQALASAGDTMKLRHYDPASHTFIFGNKAFPVRAIVTAAEAVLQRMPIAREALDALSN